MHKGAFVTFFGMYEQIVQLNEQNHLPQGRASVSQESNRWREKLMVPDILQVSKTLSQL